MGFEEIDQYLSGKREWVAERRGGLAATAGAVSVAAVEGYNRMSSGESIWNPVESGGPFVPPYLPGIDSLAHGVGFLSVAKIAMEPDEFPIPYDIDYPDAWKPVVGVGLVGIGGGIMLKEGYMEYGIHNLDTAGQFLSDLVHYNVYPDEQGIDVDDYWDMLFDVVPTALYSQWKGYNAALKEAVSQYSAEIREALSRT